MITHIVTLSWKPEITDEQIDAIRAGLEALPAAIPEIRSYSCGRDLGVSAGNADFAIVATFDSIEGWRAYDTHPRHDQVRAELIRPWLAGRSAAQIQS